MGGCGRWLRAGGRPGGNGWGARAGGVGRLVAGAGRGLFVLTGRLLLTVVGRASAWRAATVAGWEVAGARSIAGRAVATCGRVGAAATCGRVTGVWEGCA